MKKIIKQITTSKRTIHCLFILVRIYLLTVFVRIENEKEWLERVKKGEKILICMLHQQFFFTIRFFRKYLCHHPCIMISKSRDGQIGAWVAEFSGAYVARGSSSSGGKQAMQEMIAHLKQNKGFCINLVDGPRGPVGIVKSGSVRISQKAGASIVPAYFISRRYWQLNSWDGFIIPKPFSRVTLKFGESMDVPGRLSSDEFESVRGNLETAMAPYLVKKSLKRKSQD